MKRPFAVFSNLATARDLIGKNSSAAAQPAGGAAAAGPEVDMAALDRIVGRKGEVMGTVYKYTWGRDDLQVTEMGAVINARMGFNTWAVFAGSQADAQIAGDIAMKATEVQAVLKALASARFERGGDSSSHAGNSAHHHFSALLAAGAGGEAGGTIPCRNEPPRAMIRSKAAPPQPGGRDSARSRRRAAVHFEDNALRDSLIPLCACVTLLKTSKFIQTEGRTFLFS
jgi:Domain of Unknown Function (DUF1259)